MNIGIMAQFCKPYFSLAVTSAYSLLKNLEALNILGIWHGPYIELLPTVQVIVGLYLILIPLILVFNVISAFSLSNRLAIILAIIWITPGVLSVLGYQIIKPSVPPEYTIGYGNIGNENGTLANVALVFIFGWSLFILLMHIFRARSRFRNIYDHIWYII